VALRQGDEMGRFLLGSTVVLLFPRGPLAWNAQWAPGGAIRMGERMADRGAGRAADPGAEREARPR
jgi:phosphatidylserine decarboxylase